MKDSNEEQLTLQELIDMCQTLPNNVSIAKKSALDRAASELGLMSGNQIKNLFRKD